MREDLLEFLASRGTLMDPDVAEYLSGKTDPVAHLVKILKGMGETPLILTMQDIARAEQIALVAAQTSGAQAVSKENATPQKLKGIAPAKDFGEDLLVLKDITGGSTCRGVIEDFSRYFNHRFKVLFRMLRARRELQGALEIAKAKRVTREVRFIGMVTEVRVTKNGHKLVAMEDESDRVSVLLPSNSQLASEVLVTDEVVGVVGITTEKGMVVAESIVRPDVPTNREYTRSVDPVCVAFASDVHVGSKTFLKEKWERLRDWFNSSDDLARSVRYLVIDGDIVDGIGVYPRQDEELEIDDIYGQYETAAQLFSELPDHVRIVLLPGNHDAVRPAEPQPALPQSVQNLFDSNVTFLGNPSLFQLHGVKILGYHGRSMDDFVSNLPAMNYNRPLDAMREMLKRRHLAPIYGGKTPIAPESQDYLIMEDVPDIFATGHVHSVGIGEYRGVVLINSSTWQSQTSYQKMHNIVPIPCRLPIVNLATGQAVIKAF